MDYSIDINCDVGEGIGNEAELMPYISSCNIACGGHAGDEDTMRKVAKLADSHNVKIGAHPSFPDRENFGRQKMSISCSALYKSLEDQISALIDVLRKAHLQLHHVKPHGALYNLAVVDEEIATVVVEVMKRFHLPLKLYVPYKSIIAEIAIKENIPITYEAFADRNYNSDLTLVSRQNASAIITDYEASFAHIYRMITQEKVRSISGVEVGIKADTFCVHGDHPEAVKLVVGLSKKLAKNNIKIR